jgi:hypothetical protein
MSLPGWMGWPAQPCLPRGGKSRQVRPCLEVLEDRLTPSADVLTLPTSPQGPNLGQSSQAFTVQLQDGSGKTVTVNFSPSSDSQYNAFINSLGNPLSSLPSILASASSAGGQTTSTANGSSLNGAGNSAIQQEIAVQLIDDIGNLLTALNSVLAQAISTSGAGSSGFAIPSSGGGTPTLTATQQEIIQGLNSLVFTTSPLTPSAGQNSQPVTLQLDANNGNATTPPSNGPIIYLASNPTSPLGSSTMDFVDANGNPLPTSG